jgi:hypothetical protein
MSIKLLSVNYFMVTYLATKGVKVLHIKLTTCTEMSSLEQPKFALLVKNLRAFNGNQKFITAPHPHPSFHHPVSDELETQYKLFVLLNVQYLPGYFF